MNIRYAGLDWASQLHAASIIDQHGREMKRWEITHNKQDLAEMCRILRRAEVVGVAIERPTGLVVETLLDAGLQVVPIHPNIVKATRPRYTTNGSKSDASDAYMLADMLRTDGHRFQPLRVQDPPIRALRALVRARDALRRTRTQLANQLRSHLELFWPGPVRMFCAIDSQISLAFIARYPTPASAKRLGVARMSRFCKSHGYSGRSTAQELLQQLREAPCVEMSEEELDVQGLLVRSLVAVLQPLVEQERALTHRIEHDITELADGQILMSLPRAGRLGAAQILAELGSVRERFDCPERLAAESGTSPYTKKSGKHRSTHFRWACNRRLRVAITRFADNSRHASEWAATRYANAISRGLSHPQAIRVLARAWINVIWRMWMDRTQYDPCLHAAARHLKPAGG